MRLQGKLKYDEHFTSLLIEFIKASREYSGVVKATWGGGLKGGSRGETPGFVFWTTEGMLRLAVVVGSRQLAMLRSPGHRLNIV